MTDTARIRAVLEDERARTVQDVEALTADLAGVIEAATDVATDDEHDPEGATIAFERSRLTALANQGRDHIIATDAALRRLDNGDYGRCQSCGEPIATARLDALPSVATCIACSALAVRVSSTP